MTLSRRMALFITALLALALAGALVIHTLGSRQVLQQQLDLRNRDAAATLALALSSQGGDQAALRSVAAAQFDLGHYARIALTAPDGRLTWEMVAPPDAPRGVPAWFAALLPLQVAPGQALVSAGWREVGTLRIESHTAWARAALWRASLRTAGLLAALGAAALALSAWMLGSWQRPLAATVLQAKALEQGRFIEAAEPHLPELKTLTRSMNATVRRLHQLAAAQAEQVAHLQRQAQLDALTGLPLRHQFLALVQRRLNHADAAGVGVLLLRLGGLEEVNRRQGREAADALLARLGALVRQHLQAEPDTQGGRLTGSDVGLLLPLPGLAEAAARSLHQAAAQALAPLPPGVRLDVMALDGAREARADALFNLALEMLPRAQAHHGLACTAFGPLLQGLADPAAGAARVRQALAQGRARLAEFPVLDAQGELLHLECPLRLQLAADGPFEPAARWLPLVRRGGLMPEVDLQAIDLALTASAADGRPRAVNVALASLAEPGFVAEVAGRLAARPEAARRLSIEWVASGAQDDWAAAGQAAAAWAAHGTQGGVEHAGSAPEQLARARDIGLGYVKIDAAHLRGLAHDPGVHAYARSLISLVKLLGLKAVAEGVDDAEDLAALWPLGLDGATGKALQGLEGAAV